MGRQTRLAVVRRPAGEVKRSEAQIAGAHPKAALRPSHEAKKRRSEEAKKRSVISESLVGFGLLPPRISPTVELSRKRESTANADV